MKLDVMTFNTQLCQNFKTQKIDFDCIADTIQLFSPDIVGLNEMRMEVVKDIPQIVASDHCPHIASIEI